MLPHGMRHSKEADAKLTEDAVSRAYADPASFHIEGEKGPRPKYIPEDLDEYAWLINRKYIFRVVVFSIVLGLLAGGWIGVEKSINWYNEQQELYKNDPHKCNGSGVSSYFCAGKENLKGQLGV